MIEKYKIEKQPIYENSDRKIYKGTDFDNRQYIFKSINLDSEYTQKLFHNELKLLDDTNLHTFLPGIEVIIDEEIPYLVYPRPKTASLVAHNSSDFNSINTLFIRLLNSIKSLHEKGYIHGNLNPGSIYYESEKVKIYNPGVYVKIDERSRSYLPSSTIYCSKERQLNKKLSYATDVYSLGQILIFLYTGAQPNLSTASEKSIINILMNKFNLKFNNCNLIYKILVKLTDNDPENRFQSIDEVKNSIISIIKSTRDKNDYVIQSGQKFKVTDKLIGRTIELNRVMRLFTEKGKVQIISVKGGLGVGKTKLIDEAIKLINEEPVTNLVLDLEKLPDITILSCLHSLLQDLISIFKVDIKLYEDSLGQLLPFSTNGRDNTFIATVLENSKTVISSLLKDSALSNFIPVLNIKNLGILNLNDRLALLEILASMPLERGVVFIEDSFKESWSPYDTIYLNDFSQEEVKSFLINSIDLDSDNLQKITSLCHTKTSGNPFYLKEFLQSLYSEGILTFNYISNTYNVDLSQINSVKITANVAKLVIRRVQNLKIEVLEFLKVIYCLGEVFYLKDLFLLYNNNSDILKIVKLLIQNEIIYLKDGTISEFYWNQIEDTCIKTCFSFTHYSIYQYLSSLFIESEEEEIHFDIVRRWFRGYDASISDISRADNMYKSWTLVEDEQLSKYYIETLYSSAVRKSNELDWERAFEYLQVIIKFYTVDMWESEYNFTLDFFNLLIKCSYQIQQFNVIYTNKDIICSNIKSIKDCETFYTYIVLSLIADNRKEEAWNISIEYLKLLGFSLNKSNIYHSTMIVLKSAKFKTYKKNLLSQNYSNKTNANLILSFISKIFSFLTIMYKPEFIESLSLYSLSLVKKYGITSSVPELIIFWGLLYSRKVKKYKDLRSFYKFSNKLHGMITGEETPQYLYLKGILSPLIKSNTESIRILSASYTLAFQRNDFLWASISVVGLRWMLFMNSFPLKSLINNVNTDIERFKIHNYKEPVYKLESLLIMCNLLTGNSKQQDIGELRHGIDIHKFIIQVKLSLILNQSNFFDSAKDLYCMRKFSLSPIIEFLCRYYYVLSLLFKDGITNKEKREIDKNLKILSKIVKEGSKNLKIKYLFLKGYLLVKLKNKYSGFWLIEDAIEKSREEQIYCDIGIFCEKAYQLNRLRNSSRSINFLIYESHLAYKRWGASYKCRQLEKSYPEVFYLQKCNSSVDNLYSSENITSAANSYKVYKELLSQMLKTYNSSKVVCILQKDQELVVDSLLKKGNFTKLDSYPAALYNDIPQSIINYVHQSKQSINLLFDHNFTEYDNDPYIKKSKLSSIKAGPICYENTYLGIYYIENKNRIINDNKSAILNTLLCTLASYIQNHVINNDLYKENKLLLRTVNQQKMVLDRENYNIGSKVTSKHNFIARINYEILHYNRYKNLFSIGVIYVKSTKVIYNNLSEVLIKLFCKHTRNIDLLSIVDDSQFLILLPKTNFKGCNILLQKLKLKAMESFKDITISFQSLEYSYGLDSEDIINQLLSIQAAY